MKVVSVTKVHKEIKVHKVVQVMMDLKVLKV